MDRKTRWLVVVGAILMLTSIGIVSASAQEAAQHHGPMQAFSDPNWQPRDPGSSVSTMQPFSDPNWRSPVRTGSVDQPQPVGGGANVSVVALIAGLTALAAGIGAFAGTMRFKKLRVSAGG